MKEMHFNSAGSDYIVIEVKIQLIIQDSLASSKLTRVHFLIVVLSYALSS